MVLIRLVEYKDLPSNIRAKLDASKISKGDLFFRNGQISNISNLDKVKFNINDVSGLFSAIMNDLTLPIAKSNLVEIAEIFGIKIEDNAE